MTAPEIEEILERLNKTKFKGVLKWESYVSTGPECWGPKNETAWEITYEDDLRPFVCWINNAHHFEIKHGHSGNFGWWLDISVANEVAKVFEGTIDDDGDGEISEPRDDFYPTFEDWLDAVFSHCKWPIKVMMKKMEYQYAPKSFRSDKYDDIDVKIELTDDDGNTVG